MTPASSPPTLPIPRQPSPLSFPVASYSPPPSPDARSPSSPPRSPRPSITESTVSSALPPDVEVLSRPAPARRTSTPPTRAYVPRTGEDLVPILPVPDSLLFRSTVGSLEASTLALKRLSKAVLHSSSALAHALEAVEKAEDELLVAMGSMGRWLEVGFGLPPGDLWGEEGVRKVRRGKWRSQREEVEGMVVQGVTSVKAELKRHGLAGGGGQARFDRATKHYYDQTGAYLSDAPAGGSVDSEQTSRTAQFDLLRYSHHSTLLYAAPPSSISCLDLLVNLYNWTGGLLGEHTQTRDLLEDGYGSTPSLIPVSHPGPRLRKGSYQPSTVQMKDEVSLALGRLAGIRSELLDGWARRNYQTTRLEGEAKRTSKEVEKAAPSASAAMSGSSAGAGAAGAGADETDLLQTTPISSSGVEHKKKRMHKLHRSVGGRLRDLLSSSGSSRELSLDKLGNLGSGFGSGSGHGHGKGDKSARNSFDVSLLSGGKQTYAYVEPDLPPIPEPSSKSAPLPPPGEKRPMPPARRSTTHLETTLETLEASPMPRSIGKGLPPMPSYSEDVGRKKEGVLWGGGVWEEVGKAGRTKWEKYWVVLDRSMVYEYRDADFDRPETPHAVIDLKFASAREGRGIERRFVFEIVTPTQGRRLYQATSEAEMKQWIYAISNAIESSINGTSSVRTFDTSKLRTISGAYDDHAVPIRQRLGFPIPGIPGRGMGMSTAPSMPSIPSSPSTNARRSMPPPTREDMGIRKRQTSFKKALRQSAEIASSWKDGLGRDRDRDRDGGGSSGSGRPPFLAPTARQNSGSSSVSHASHTALVSRESRDPDRSFGSWYEVDVDGEIEKRVMEMAGLGLGTGTGSGTSPVRGPGRRVQSETRPGDKAPGGGLGVDPAGAGAGGGMTRSKSADVVLDMETLRRVAGTAENAQCADCGKNTRASRWASICLREKPMVVFLCIRCCGVHRSFGTHISKPRSVDLDIWTPETIGLAREWGNERANRMWEWGYRGERPGDDEVGEFIRAKYVEGRWLSDEWRERFGLVPVSRAPPEGGDGVALGEPERATRQ